MQNYTCDSPTDLTSTNHSTYECIGICTYTLQHNDSFIFLRWSALYLEADADVQSWGIEEVIIAEMLCHAYCATCTGALDTECLSCNSGYYLQGNTCVQTCSTNSYAVPNLNRCLGTCPAQFYSNTNANGIPC